MWVSSCEEELITSDVVAVIKYGDDNSKGKGIYWQSLCEISLFTYKSHYIFNSSVSDNSCNSFFLSW